ncbi:unnamed protein product [Moneuplotes crassus]|uniref:Uncharacterized protein n=1 Tax=Euplotes crassus TaxID=5936 RepID=A0AAD1XW12_EUPCR|nr:unnamed protein product [Moneuplotes crassus]
MDKSEFESKIERIKQLEAQVAKNKKLITQQEKDIKEIQDSSAIRAVADEIETRKRALNRARRRFEEKKEKFYNEDLDKYEKKLLSLKKKNLEEKKIVTQQKSPYESLIVDLIKICKDPVKGTVMRDPVSLPSGEVYDADTAKKIRKGKITTFNEPKVPNMFREDKFTNRLIKIVEKYEKAEEKLKPAPAPSNKEENKI